jgi:hypothetical protein
MKELLAAIVLSLAAMTCAAQGQQPYYPPPVYRVEYRPVYVPGDYVAAPRHLNVMEALFGPRLVWVPRPPQVPYANPPVQPQQAPAQ